MKISEIIAILKELAVKTGMSYQDLLYFLLSVNDDPEMLPWN